MPEEKTGKESIFCKNNLIQFYINLSPNLYDEFN